MQTEKETPSHHLHLPDAARIKLVDAEGLLEALFDKDSRPSLRWLRKMQAQRRVPYIKLGHLVRFDVEDVRAALREDWTVRNRRTRRRT